MIKLLTLTAFAFFAIVSNAGAQQGNIGPVTNLPLPRYVSLKTDDAFVRRGPALTHRIDWVLNRRGTPLQVTAEYSNWLRVVDAEGAGGWVHRALLSGVRHVVVTDENATLFDSPDDNSDPVAIAEKGVIAVLGSCDIEWCEVSVDGYEGWVLKIAIWGVDDAELRE